MRDLHKVWEIKALKRKPGEEEAKKILEKIAKQVQPIWRHPRKVKAMKTEPRLFIPSIKFLIQCFMSFARMLMDVSIYGFTIKHYLCGKERAYVIGIKAIMNDF
ncbi:hypothetical protein Gotur_035268 [Gossypium turneri]